MIQSSRAHLAEVDENYLEHQRIAFRFAGNCLKAAVMAFVHGIIPGYFQRNASKLIKQLANKRKPEDSVA